MMGGVANRVTHEPTRSSAKRGTISGTAFVAGFLVVALVTVLSVLFLSPRLQEDAVARLDGLIDRSVLVTGTFDGEDWVIAAEIENDDTCLLVELREQVGGRVCDGGSGAVLREAGVTPLQRDSRWFFTGITDPDVPIVRLDLSEGDSLILRVQRPRGYQSGFYVTALDPDVRVQRVTAVSRGEQVLGTLTCEPAVATVNGIGADCRRNAAALG